MTADRTGDRRGKRTGDGGDGVKGTKRPETMHMVRTRREGPPPTLSVGTWCAMRLQQRQPLTLGARDDGRRKGHGQPEGRRRASAMTTTASWHH